VADDIDSFVYENDNVSDLIAVIKYLMYHVAFNNGNGNGVLRLPVLSTIFSFLLTGTQRILFEVLHLTNIMRALINEHTNAINTCFVLNEQMRVPTLCLMSALVLMVTVLCSTKAN
jgi:hypothetical protein